VTQRTEGAAIRFDATLSTIDTSTVLRLRAGVPPMSGQ